MELLTRHENLPMKKWEELYVLTNHWISDLDFYRDELRFLKGLIDRYFQWVEGDENILKVQQASARLSEITVQHLELGEKAKRHLSKIGVMLEYPAGISADFSDSHSHLEEWVASFVKSFRVVKKEIFRLTEEVVESEKLEHLLER